MKQRLHPIELTLMIVAALALTSGAVALHTQSQLAEKVVRLHVLANSDSEEDQALKLKVRDAVLEQATETLRGADSQAEASRRLTDILPELEETARAVITANGYDYGVRAELAETSFPTKEYDGFALPAGEYLALRVLIGEAAGQNWWCVLYPSLCFTNATCAVVDEDGKKELKEALSAEEYEMVTAASEFKIKWFFFGNSDKNTEEEHTKESD